MIVDPAIVFEFTIALLIDMHHPDYVKMGATIELPVR
jgi:hypothetical protein